VKHAAQTASFANIKNMILPLMNFYPFRLKLWQLLLISVIKVNSKKFAKVAKLITLLSMTVRHA